MSHIIGLWCGGSVVKNILRTAHEMPCLTLVKKRIDLGPQIALVPWDASLDWLEAEVRAQHLSIVRCAPDERIAMRDLVAALKPEVGILIQGDCCDIDKAEVQLAIARLRFGFERYESKRIKAFKSQDWLSVSDSDEWPARVDVTEFGRTRPPVQLLEDTRRNRARQVIGKSDEQALP